GPIDARQVSEEKARQGISGRYFLYVGGLQFNKNVPAIIEAFRRVAGSDRDVQLVMAGEHRFWPRQRRRLAEQIARCGLQQRIVFTGQLSPGRLKPLYAGAVALVHPALYEGFGFTPLEAMACGCPVIVSNVSAIPEVVGDAGMYVNPADPAEIAHAMALLLSSPEQRIRLIETGRMRSGRFTWRDCAWAVKSLYEKLSAEDRVTY
ncbi:MAG: glycosyltransferase family 1 protein, partial [Candidatus Edwardsbacteria bacterium]|nr:glycosyltransferase family 1 protein [Candidatus Edwardsbacteria bacterium]